MKDCKHKPAVISIDRSINHAGRSGLTCKYCGAPLKCVNSKKIRPAVLPFVAALIAHAATDIEYAIGRLVGASDPALIGTILLMVVSIALSAGLAALIWPKLIFIDKRTVPKDPLYQKEPDPEVYNKYEL